MPRRLLDWSVRSGALSAVAVALLAAAAVAQLAADPQAIYDRVAPSIATLQVGAEGRSATGTAFAFNASGQLLTAAHVVRGAERIRVEFADGSSAEAHLVGYDARRDLAVIRADSTPLPLPLIGAEALKVGDPVFVVGSPRGRPLTVSAGQVLANGTTLAGLVPGIMIRNSAPIQPGHSGSPLLDGQGRAVGVVVAISTRPGEEGGLAVSGSVVRETLPALLAGVRRERAWLGIVAIALDASLARQRNLPVDRGMLVVEVQPGSPAEQAGLRGDRKDGPVGDVIVALDGYPVATWEDVMRVLGAREPGQRMQVEIVRESRQVTVEVTLGARP
ncbi:MAG: trypsin-like peptidase domain-containing protein [Armatimonadota bacterium]|nr:trypsin-like peptidase domain-containing protein [Armatimonadota bacterium]